ncbi:MAG: acetate kinase, partial [Oscillospiraceae bacterium]|nr:acetate kinase [Oscillospiraceae bacterium]
HRYVSARASELLDVPAESSRVVTCHLGNGSSIAAVLGGKCVDTTMGLTPLEGLPMGTRSGSIDPAVIQFVSDRAGISLGDVITILNKESGVLGVSGVSSDFRDIEAAAGSGNARARLALEIFYYQTLKYVSSYIGVLGGADAIVFTAGLGENSPSAREAIVERLGGIGITIDKEKNKTRGVLAEITGEGSNSRVFVIPTNEELVIARDTKQLVSNISA